MASITKKPNGKVASMTTPKRNSGTQTFTGTWKVPASHTDSDNNARATGVDVDYDLYFVGGRHTYIRDSGGTAWNDCTLRLNSDWRFQDGNRYNRQSFHPYNPDNKLDYILFSVRETNSKGHGAWTQLRRNIELPYTPTMSAPDMSEQGETQGEVSVEVEWTKDGSGYHDADRCQRWIYVTDTTVSEERQEYSYSTTGSEGRFTMTYDAVNRMRLGWNDYIKVEFEAVAQGWKGDSKKAAQQFTIAYPRVPTISNVDVSGADYTSKVTALVDLNNADPHPVTGCVLEKLVGTTAATEAEATASDQWARTGAVDNGQCSALAITAEDLLSGSAPGQTIWLRVKSWNSTEAIFYRYSKPWRVTELETPQPSAQTSTIHLIRAIPAEDGKSALVTLAWDDGGVPMTRTELSWSNDENAWKSTNGPTVYDFDWTDGPLTNGGVTYPDSAQIYIRGLSEGIKYYIRARRVLEGEVATTYSNYTPEPGVVMPVTAPSNVTLTLPAFVPRSDSMQAEWTYDSEATQTAWQLISGELVTVVDETTVPPTITETWTEGVVVASGSDMLGSTIIDAARLAAIAGDDDAASFAVRVSVGGDFVESRPQTVRIADAPRIYVDDIATLGAQPLAFDVYSTADAQISYTVLSQGASGEYPDGARMQVAGDTVYSAIADPIWTDSEDAEYPRMATVTLPSGFDFWDGAQYTLHVTATDTATQLASERVEAEFGVAWQHQAPAPASSITVTPIDTTDADGFRTMAARITLAAPTGSAASDVYDVYRMTADGAYLVATGAAFTDVITDNYAPYGSGSHAYRIACRTVDGDVNWLDYPYALAGGMLRIDFGASYIELPWNLSVADTYQKQFETRAHLGETQPQGYWNETVNRTASYSSDVLRISETAQIDSLRDLARYGGAAFVRTPNGGAFQANIDVGGLDESYDGAFVAVSLDATEVALTDYMATQPAAEMPDGE